MPVTLRGMGRGLSAVARAEITARYAKAYRVAPRAVKVRLLDEVVAVTGWSRDNARRRLSQALVPRPVRSKPGRPRKFSPETAAVLERVWAVSGGSCGKYLAVAMPGLITGLERHGELVAGRRGYSAAVRAELLTMSPATIDRYLAATKARGALKGVSTTKPGTLLRTSITIRKAGDEVEAEPGFFEADTVAHCGPTLKGEFARTVNLTDMITGWVATVAIRNNARVHVIAALDQALTRIPFPVAGLDFDNGSEFINHDLVAWAGERDIFFTRSRPYKKNDQATIESKNNHLVRRYGFHWRYDTPEALMLLNRLWPLVNDRLNYLIPTKKPTGWATSASGRRKRVYDTPKTPLDRLLAARILAPAQESELIAYRDALNPAEIARNIQRLQDQLTGLARRPTLDLQTTALKPPPDTARSVRLRPAS